MTIHKNRCAWCDETSSLYVEYHDTEWGVPVNDDRKLFEMLILEGMQAGLSWLTILRKRNNFREAFDGFECEKIARYSDPKIHELLTNEGIIRNKLKIKAAIQNARVFLDMQKEFGSFSKYLWQWVDGVPVQNTFKTLSDLPAKTELSQKISKDLKKRGMNFVGPTIIYAFMQAIGVVNDHETGCFRYQQCKEIANTL
jgi:DNA-3-methyladenine glycosylase I